MSFCIACDDREGSIKLFMHPRHLDSMFFDITTIPVSKFQDCVQGYFIFISLDTNSSYSRSRKTIKYVPVAVTS